MCCDLNNILKNNNQSIYRQLHYECGMLGQQIYIDCGARDYGACGLGCYCDDIILQKFGIDNKQEDAILVPLYAFCVGIPIDDGRYLPYEYESSMIDFVFEVIYAPQKK